ncbi:MAG: tetratricopeptide repeat protein [Spirochaetota bacterium]
MNFRANLAIERFLIYSIILLFMVACSTKKPVLYKDGNPLSITDYEKVAQKEFDEGRYKNAIAVYQAIIDNYPENQSAKAWAYYEIGYCYYAMEDYQQAEIYFRKVLNEYQEPAAKALAEKMLGKLKK